MASYLIEIFAALLVLFLILVPLGLLVFSIVFWVWMLIDCLERKNFEDKLVWVLVLLFLNVFGAILYYFLVKKEVKKRKRKRKKK
jgi:formate hydrogenlyase subunit 3/multisubunit Na+/H+ antiporter MnhD subunit